MKLTSEWVKRNEGIFFFLCIKILLEDKMKKFQNVFRLTFLDCMTCVGCKVI